MIGSPCSFSMRRKPARHHQLKHPSPCASRKRRTFRNMANAPTGNRPGLEALTVRPALHRLVASSPEAPTKAKRAPTRVHAGSSSPAPGNRARRSGRCPPMRLRAVNIVLLDMRCRGRAHPGTAGRDHLTRFAGPAAHPPLTRHRHDVRGPHLHAFGRDGPVRRRTVDLRSAGADQFARAHDSQDHPLQGPPGVRTAGICLHLEQQLRNLLRAPICPRSRPAVNGRALANVQKRESPG